MAGFLSWLRSKSPWRQPEAARPTFEKERPLSALFKRPENVVSPELEAATFANDEADAFVHFGVWMDSPQSSNIARMRYLADESAIEVEFKNGNYYRVDDISIAEARAFAAAESKGKAYWSIVRVRGKGNFWATRKPYSFISGISAGQPQWMRSPKTRRIHALATGKASHVGAGAAIRKPKILGQSLSRILAPRWGGKRRG